MINENINIIMYILKSIIINIFAYFTSKKILNNKNNKKVSIFLQNILIIFVSIICAVLKYKISTVLAMIFLCILMSYIYSVLNKERIGKAILINLLSLSISYMIFFLAIICSFIIGKILNIKDDFRSFLIMIIIYIPLEIFLLKTKKIKNGIIFLKDNFNNDVLDLLVMNISIIVYFSCIISTSYDIKLIEKLIIGFIIFILIIVSTIQKSLQLYYKQQMLIKDLTETKEELENKKKEIEELEAENIRISKKNHTIVHKQKSIEHKLEEILTKTEISTEEASEVKERLSKLHSQIYSDKENTKLPQTGISNIDDMLNYMQSECIKNKIEFTLIIKGNIHYMTNNIISKEDLETLLADHIKDAIIAINHTDNINRSIMVKLGNIDGIYSLYIYDSGVEFPKEVLNNLGKKPYTTYKSEGGTGMGFMNTFDTLKKYKASLLIEEFNEPKADNYTKSIAIKFDSKEDFKVKSYHK